MGGKQKTIKMGKNEKLMLIKMKNLWLSEDAIRRVKRQATQWEMMAKDKRISKEFLKINDQKNP